MKLKFFLFLLITLTIIHQTSSIATVRYVSKTGTSTPPYTSWETASDSIQKCINICSFGDTIYVANGIYKEQVIMIPGLSLIGAGIDSCVIDTKDLVTNSSFRAVQVADSCLFTGFCVNVYYNSDMGRGIYAVGNCLITQNKSTNAIQGINSGFNSTVYQNICAGNRIGIEAFNSNSIIRKNYVYQDYSGGFGILIEAFDFTYKPIIDSNYIEVNEGDGIRNSAGSKPTITNNTIRIKYAPEGIHLYVADSAKVFNNLIISVNGAGSGIFTNGVTMEAYNNYLTGDYFLDLISMSPNNWVKNNIISNTSGNISTYSTQNLVYKYNNIWSSNVTYSGFTSDTTNLSVDPMIVNEDTTQGKLDFHLQKYSPLIDAGDPTMKDKDSSKIDIGLYGGLYGEVYKYNDLAPREPRNLSAVVDTNQILVKWNRNTEADTAYYKVYRDTTVNFIIDSTKLISSSTDTFFVQLPPYYNGKNIYKITCVDKQGNESLPSVEVVVDLTSVSSDEYPMIVNDYMLYQNYPNPFNPSTKIAYKLKEQGYVKLYVYDIKGELVTVLVNKEQNAGFYEVEFTTDNQLPTTNNLASGVYIYQLMVKSESNIPVFSDMKKMLMIK